MCEKYFYIILESTLSMSVCFEEGVGNIFCGKFIVKEQWRTVNFYIGRAKKNQEKFNILSKYAIFASLLIEAASIIPESLRKKILEKPFSLIT